MANFQATELNPWNPFCSTKRDLKRTDELAKKNPIVAGVLTAIFPLFGMLYLNRGVNCLKILGYVFLIGFAIGLTVDPEEDVSAITNVVGLGGTAALVVEQVGSINQARKRKNNG